MGIKAKVRYEWRPGFSARGAKAAVVGREIEKIRETRGEVTPEDVVERAATDDSPLHNLFDWDDDVAGAKWRLHQARNVLGAIVRVTVSGGEETRFRALVHAGGEYKRTQDVVDDDELREEVDERLFSEVVMLIERYKSFRRVAGVVDDLRLLLAKWQKVLA